MKSGFAGPSREGNCGVTAVATITETDFGVVFETIKHRFNHPGNWRGRTHSYEIEWALEYFGAKFNKVTYSSSRANSHCPFLWEWALLTAKSGITYLITIPGHAITYKDFTFMDQVMREPTSIAQRTKIGNACVISYLEITKTPSNEEKMSRKNKAQIELAELF